MELYVVTYVVFDDLVRDKILEKFHESYANNYSLGFLMGERKGVVHEYRRDDTLTIKDIVIPAQDTTNTGATISPHIVHEFITNLKKKENLNEFIGIMLYTGNQFPKERTTFLESLKNLIDITGQNLTGIITNERDETLTIKNSGSSWLYTQNF